MNLINFFALHQREILQATLEHIWLVGIAMLLAVAIAIAPKPIQPVTPVAKADAAVEAGNTVDATVAAAAAAARRQAC